MLLVVGKAMQALNFTKKVDLSCYRILYHPLIIGSN